MFIACPTGEMGYGRIDEGNKVMVPFLLRSYTLIGRDLYLFLEEIFVEN